MRPALSILNSLEAAFKPSGIAPRGIVRFEPGEGPDLGQERYARVVALLGNLGSSIWPAFVSWREAQADHGGENPLDKWSKAVITPVAERFGATAWFPSDPPYMPFQSWAKKAEGLEASPLGVLIHPEFGLWHGYRGALGFEDAFDVDEVSQPPSPCHSCQATPCLSTCPVSAIRPGDFDLAACRNYLATEAGRSSCLKAGCIARAACPVGADYRYCDDQLTFHMRALWLPTPT